jgi:hypothetical protein
LYKYFIQDKDTAMPNDKTVTNPRGGGRVKGKVYPHLQNYPGIQKEQRLSWNRMKAQAKFRDEPWDISWEEFRTIWATKWHQRGRDITSLCLTRIDWNEPWTVANTQIVTRLAHVRMQGQQKRIRNQNKSK